MFLRRRAKDATAEGGEIILDGHEQERLPNNTVYVSPASGNTYDGSKGDTLAQLPPDAISLPKSTWGGYEYDAPFFYPSNKWYNTYDGTRRLNLEKLQMWQNSPFQLRKDPSENLFWIGQLVSHGHLHHEVTLHYSEDHPHEEMKVYIKRPQLPQVNHHIFSDGKICYQLSNWNSSWTALTVLGTVMRFLDDFYSGRMREGYQFGRVSL